MQYTKHKCLTNKLTKWHSIWSIDGRIWLRIIKLKNRIKRIRVYNNSPAFNKKNQIKTIINKIQKKAILCKKRWIFRLKDKLLMKVPISTLILRIRRDVNKIIGMKLISLFIQTHQRTRKKARQPRLLRAC